MLKSLVDFKNEKSRTLLDLIVVVLVLLLILIIVTKITA